MTEDEAKLKWCPFARTKTAAFHQEVSGPAGVNRDFDGEVIDQLHTCIASACMAWRNREAVTFEVVTDLGHLPPGWHDDEASWEQIPRRRGEEGLHWRKTVSKAAGYCGLAGRPS